MSEWIMMALMVQYGALTMICFYNKQCWLGTYWLGASILQFAIMGGMMR